MDNESGFGHLLEQARQQRVDFVNDGKVYHDVKVVEHTTEFPEHCYSTLTAEESELLFGNVFTDKDGRVLKPNLIIYSDGVYRIPMSDQKQPCPRCKSTCEAVVEYLEEVAREDIPDDYCLEDEAKKEPVTQHIGTGHMGSMGYGRPK